MEDSVKLIIEKITSYNIFNNLLPGVLFCFILNKTTRFNLSSSNIIEQLFVWYFVGMIISRIGSLIVEENLKKIKTKGSPYIKFADYKNYVAATEINPVIATLSEANNTYRSMISLLLSLGIVCLYDAFVYDWITHFFPYANKIVQFGVALFLGFLFIKSYKKQTDYVRINVENSVSRLPNNINK